MYLWDLKLKIVYYSILYIISDCFFAMQGLSIIPKINHLINLQNVCRKIHVKQLFNWAL